MFKLLKRLLWRLHNFGDAIIITADHHAHSREVWENRHNLIALFKKHGYDVSTSEHWDVLEILIILKK